MSSHSSLWPGESALKLGFGLLGLGLLASCYREVSDPSIASAYPRYQGTAPWMVDDVRPGQSLDEIKRRRGEPKEQIGPAMPPTFRWPGPRDTTVTFDPSGRAIDVFGSTVTAEGRPLVSRGMDAETIQQVLGRGKVSKHSRPTGSGVISFGRTSTGSTIIYENHGAVFEIGTGGETPGWVRARPKR